MYLLFFLIMMPEAPHVLEYFPKQYKTKQSCQDAGWRIVEEVSQQILDKNPEMVGFKIDCLKIPKKNTLANLD